MMLTPKTSILFCNSTRKNFLSGFSFTNIHDSQDNRGRVTTPLTPLHTQKH